MIRSITCVLLSLLYPLHSLGSDNHNLTDIHTGVIDYLHQQYPQTPVRHSVNIEAKKLDKRLKLTRCDELLTHKLLKFKQYGGHITVQTRCEGRQPWSIYVPAKVEVTAMLVVAKESLLKGTLLDASHLEMKPRQLSRSDQNSATDSRSLIGKQLKRAVRQGDKIRLNQLVSPNAVKRGDFVSLVASTGAITVVTKGTALSAGRIGEQIKVRNNKSERIIKGQITGPGKVNIIL